MFKVGDIILYNGEKYEVLFVYTNTESYELKNMKDNSVDLVDGKKLKKATVINVD